MKIKVFTVLFAFLISPLAYAQFGKNQVLWEKVEENFYRTAHFDIYHSLDANDPKQMDHFNYIVSYLEASYENLSKELDHRMSETKGRIPIIVYRTHSIFEANHITGPFLPEGVGAFAEPLRNRLVLKVDFLPPLNKTIIAHEMSHIFQFDILSLNFMRVVGGSIGLPQWFIEGGADYLASSFNPYTRDDIRRMQQRGAAANPEKDLPTILALSAGQGNPYSIGSMVFEFIEGRYGKEAANEFLVRGLKEKRLLNILEDISEGEIDSVEKFDQLHRDYWRNLFAKDMIDRPKPYQETDNFKGRTLTPSAHFYPLLSSVLSPDGENVVSISIQKTGIAIVKFPYKEKIEWKKKEEEEEKKDKLDRKIIETWQKPDSKKKVKIQNLTPYFPPKHFEYIIAQRLNVWPNNGTDLDWSDDGTAVAFFARHNRDHALFLIDPETGKILQSIEFPLDQAFTPAFDPTGKEVYFSAAKNITRDIYVVNLETEEVTNLTNSLAFDTAPAISPDGKTLAYVSFVGDFQKLFLLDLATGEKTQLTFNRYNDNSPSFSSDSKTLVYTSERDGRIWNIFTIDIETKETSQWTNFYGGTFTPKFKDDTNKTVYYTAYWQYDQFRSFIYPNFELYEVELKEPVTTFVARDEHESMDWAFRSHESFEYKLDENQILNPEKAPENWHLSGNTAFGGYNTYWGVFGNSTISVSNMMNNNHHIFRFASYGNFFRIIDYSHINQKRRTAWGYGVFSRKLPLNYLYYNLSEGAARQFILNQTVAKEVGFNVFSQYPLNKFNRVEILFEAKKTSFTTFAADPSGFSDLPDVTENDISLFNLFREADNTSLAFSASYVRDTVYYSQNTQGPIIGSAIRTSIKIAPSPFGSLAKYVSVSADARKYFRISEGTLFAVRGTGLYSNNESGDFILMGGSNMLRAYPHGSLVGNRAFYGSAELRFPFIDAIVFPKGILIGPIRGFIFGDYAVANFDNSSFPNQTGVSYGIGLQLLPLNFAWARREIDNFKRWEFDFYVSLNF